MVKREGGLSMFQSEQVAYRETELGPWVNESSSAKYVHYLLGNPRFGWPGAQNSESRT